MREIVPYDMVKYIRSGRFLVFLFLVFSLSAIPRAEEDFLVLFLGMAVCGLSFAMLCPLPGV